MPTAKPILKETYVRAQAVIDARRYARAPKPMLAVLEGELGALRDLVKEAKSRPTVFR
jgi:hypothetical protein